MQFFGYIKEAVEIWLKKNGFNVKVRPNGSTTYTADRTLDLPEGNTDHVLVSRTSIDTLTNKTITSPVINTPTGIAKADVGLGNVDNTSDATKNAAAATLSNKTLTAPILDQALMTEGTAPSTPAAGKVAVYAKTDKKLYTKDSSGAEIQVGSGSSSGINYIGNPDAESNTTGWATYADVAAATPVDGTGGSANVTWTRNTTTPLRGNADFLLTKDAANRQGQGVSYDFTISVADKSKKLSISFDLLASTNYVASDLVAYVYDVTNSVLITPSSTSIPKLTGSHAITFDSTTSTSYRLILHVATTNALAYTVNFDNVVVGPGQLVQGAAVSEWQTFTPALFNAGPQSDTRGRWRRVGSSMEIETYHGFTGVGPASIVGLALPTGYTLNAIGYSAGDGPIGATTWYNNSVFSPMSPRLDTTGQRIQFIANGVGSTFLGNSLGAGHQLGINVRVPIAEWAGSGTVAILNTNLQSPATAGFIQPFAGSTAPSGWVLCDGSALSQSTYTQLFARIGTTWNTATNPTTGAAYAAPSAGTFRVPDFRGVFLRGVGTASGLTAVSLAGYQADNNLSHSHTLGVNRDVVSGTAGNNAGGSGGTYIGAVAGIVGNSGGDEARPRNQGVNYVIKLYDDTAGPAVGIPLATATESGLVRGGTVPGQISGATIAAGMLGERINSVNTGITLGAGWQNTGNITLTAGVWLFGGTSAGSGTPTDVVNVGISTSSTGAPNIQVVTSILGQQGEAAAPTVYLNVSATTTYYLMAYRQTGANASWGNGVASKTFAVRIA